MAEEFVLFNKFPEIIAALEEAAKVAIREVAAELTTAANMTAPYDQGVLAASGYFVASDMSTYAQAVAAATGIEDREMLPEVEHPTSETEAVIAYAASYAIYVHDGTRHMAARPWLAQTTEGARAMVNAAIATKIHDAITGAAEA